MGIPGLWDIIKEQSGGQCNVAVSELKDKMLAVDVSGWIVELQNSPSATVVHNLYIKNLFFRIIGLLNEGVNLVAVLDGKAPALKSNTLMKRQQSSTANHDRPLLNQTSKEFAELFKCFGIPCLQSTGEAEALCAYLEKNKLIDGCFTADSDYFCYGGKTVYRDLKKEGKTFMVDKYCTDKMDISHDDFIALAVILGSDYEKGIEGVGQKKSMQLINYLKDKKVSVLDRIKSWQDNQELIDIENRIGSKMEHSSHCKQCKHTGTKKLHGSNGCSICETVQGCNVDSSVTCTCSWHGLKRLETEYKLELSIRQKALDIPAFPNDEVIKEFRDFTMDVPNLQKPGTIDVEVLIRCLKKHHSFQDKIIHHITRAVILQELRNSVVSSDLLFTPVRIIKTCVENHVDCYLIEWKKTDKNRWASCGSVQEKIERELFKSVYPKLVASFEAQQTMKKTPKGKKKSDADGSQPTCSLEKKVTLEGDIRSFFKIKK